MPDQVSEVLIIGSGPAGLTAAIYTARAGLKPIVLAGYQLGGQLMTTTAVENYPGFPDGIDGPELMQRFIQQAEKWGAQLVYSDAQSVDLAANPKKVVSDGKTYLAHAVIIATGAMPRKLEIPGEAEYYGHGVSTCATCDGALYKDKVVAVVGGGDSAMEESSFLARHASKVYIIHRKDKFNASKIMSDRALANPKITVIMSTEVREIAGEGGKVHHLKLFNNKDNSEKDFPVDGLFLAIGHLPVTGFVGGITLNPLGYISSEDGVRTNIEGVFCAGDVEDARYRQAITAAGTGCRAALETQKWLEASAK